jgi:hypothetical protein
MQNKNVTTTLLLILILIFSISTVYLLLGKPASAPALETPTKLEKQSQPVSMPNNTPKQSTRDIQTNDLDFKGVNVNSISFKENGLDYEFLEIARYRAKDSSDSASFSLTQTNSDGTLSNKTYNIPAGKSVIAVKTIITNKGKDDSVSSDPSALTAIYTTPAIRAVSSQGQTEPIEPISLDVLPVHSYEYTYLFYADYAMDHAVINYGPGFGPNSQNIFVMDFNQNG